MTEITYIGSCLSGTIVKELLKARPDMHLVEGMPHMRLDVLHDYLVDGVPIGAPPELTFAMVKELFPASEKRNKFRLTSQTPMRLEQITDSLKRTDCLIVDDNYDLTASLFEISYRDETLRFVGIEVNGELPHCCKKLGLMPIESAMLKYQRLFDYIRIINPAIRIVFVHYPVTGFETEGGWNLRVRRARELAETVALRGVVSIPLVKIDDGDFAASYPAWYFSQRVYAAYAKTILAVIDGEEISLPARSEITFAELEEAGGGGSGRSVERPKPASPYAGLPVRNYWKPAVADRYPLSINELYNKRFSIATTDRVATCGSCFAQHIGRRLQAGGFNFLDVEPPPTALSKSDGAARGYGIYSARYGNVYTSAQLLQLVQRALDDIALDEAWESNGRFYDPFRPNLDPAGFPDPDAMTEERNRHLAAVRRLLEQVDVFVFTMGLTEFWYNAETSAVYPVAPGVTVGRFDPAIHKFRNLSFADVMSDMEAVLDRLRSVRPEVRVLLTVSPVPLTATAEDRHVLLSTMHSKSVLRAAAGELAARHEFIDYFPSYDIVMSSPFRGMFFQSNLRTIHEEGVDYIMSHFFEQHSPARSSTTVASRSSPVEPFCDELFIELQRRSAHDNPA